jgi:branched-chain amino acid transport system substrate-binding protein
MVSPASSDPHLTERGFETVFRVVGRDDVQGRAAAEFAASDLKARRAVIARDGSALGRAAAAAFRQAALQLGIAVGGEVEVGGDPAALLGVLGASPPDLIFLAMPFAQAGAVIREVRRREISSALIGPDWLDSPRLLQAAGRSAVGTYFTLVVGPPDFYPEAEEFVRDYRKRFVAEPAPFAIQAYDAAMLGLEAIVRVARAAGGRPSRRQVAGAIRGSTFRGLGGVFSFDPRGDPDPASYFVVRVTSANPGEWERRTLVRTLRLPPPAAPR